MQYSTSFYKVFKTVIFFYYITVDVRIRHFQKIENKITKQYIVYMYSVGVIHCVYHVTTIYWTSTIKYANFILQKWVFH